MRQLEESVRAQRYEAQFETLYEQYADDVLRMAARDGALAMGLNDCDCIAPGKQADMIVLDITKRASIK